MNTPPPGRRFPAVNRASSFLLLVLALAFDGGQVLADRATLDDTRTQIALPMDSPPVIDGVIDPAEWARAGGAAGNYWRVISDPTLWDGIRGGVLGEDSVDPPFSDEDLSFDVYAGYDANNLYIAVRVRDDILVDDDAAAGSANGMTWLDDSVEVFIDGDNSNFASRDTTGTNAEVVGTGGQFVITVNNAYRQAEAGNPGYGASSAWYARTSLTDSGYEAEFRISLATLGSPQPGDIIGFTVAVNDDDALGGKRQVLWIGQPHVEASYGNLLLGGRSYTAPKAATPTIDGVVNAGEYGTAAEIVIDRHSAIFDIASGDDDRDPSDVSYRAWVVHDAEAIYVAVDVIDDVISVDSAAAGSEDSTVWEDDSVEIFFDANNSRDIGGGTAPHEGQYVFTANRARRDAEANNPTFGAGADWFAATSLTAAGYSVEFRIRKSALLNPADDTSIGFHIAVNDDDGNGRKSQLGWSGRGHSEFTYGTLHLAGGVDAGGPFSINEISLDGATLRLSIQTPNPAAPHTIQRTATFAPPDWTTVPGVTFSTGDPGTIIATFPKPGDPFEFYRALRP